MKIHSTIFLLFFFFIALFLSGCNKADQLPIDPVPDPPQPTDVIFLGHKGGGSTTYNPPFIENTMPAMLEGLKTMNGVETDIQMSRDGTIWLFHNSSTGRASCDSLDISIILLHDSAIDQLLLCSGTKKDRIYKLVELFDHWNASSAGYPISLEVKSDFAADTFRVVGGRQAYILSLADNLAKLIGTMKHPGQLYIEAEDKYFCDRLRSYANGNLVKICKLNYVDFDHQISDALAEGFNGISSIFSDTTVTAERIKRAQDSGLVVQLWTPYSQSELTSVFKKHPNIIQTDRMNAKQLLNVQ